MKTIHIQLNKTPYVIEDDSNSRHIGIYIPGLFQLMHVDYRDKEDNFLQDIVQDIAQSKITVYQYSLAGIKMFDFEVQDSTWNDYLRTLSISKQLLKRFGKKKKIGNIELQEN